MYYAIAALVVIILDQWMKYWVASNIAFQTGSMPLIPGLISLVNIHNDGAAFGLMAGGRIIFIALTALVTILVIVAIARNWISGSLGKWCAVFIMAGGLANCIDRILYGYVQDMFMLDFMPSFAIFNVADAFISVFCILFILYILFGGEGKKARVRREEEEDSYFEDDEDDLDEEDEEPVEKPRRRLFGRAAAEDEDEFDDEEEEPAPVKPVKTSRAARQKEYDDEYARYKAQKQAAAATNMQPVQPKIRVRDENDPFAEWDRANEVSRSATRPAVPAAPVRPAAPVAPAAEPVRPAAPAAPAPKAPAAADEFNLDDILAEFKL